MRSSLRLVPLLSRVRRHLGFSCGYRANAARSWVIHPEETVTIPPAVYEPEDLQKIRAFAPGDGREIEMQRVLGGPRRLLPTVAYELSDVVLSGGQVFTAKAHHVIVPERAPLIPKRPTHEFDHAVLVSTYWGFKYFGHWMTEDLPMLMAASDIGTPVSVARHLTPAQAGYLKLLELDANAVEDAYFRKLVVIDDAGHNSYKRARFKRLRELAAPYGSASVLPGVMLLRGTSGSTRLLSNEADVANLARSRGFTVLDPARTDAEVLLRACLGAEIVLGVEGSHMTNGMLWMSQHGAMVQIQPPDRFAMILKGYCDCIGIRSAFVVAEAEPTGTFRADLDALNRVLDRISA